MNCKQCGHCCIVKSTVCLTPKEVLYGNFLYRKKPLDDDIILKKKNVYIPELKYNMTVCIYYDPENKKCIIHKRQPKACKEMVCNGDQLENGSFLSWPPKKLKCRKIRYGPKKKSKKRYYTVVKV